jgi:hypothetical protein
VAAPARGGGALLTVFPAWLMLELTAAKLLLTRCVSAE